MGIVVVDKVDIKVDIGSSKLSIIPRGTTPIEGSDVIFYDCRNDHLIIHLKGEKYDEIEIICRRDDYFVYAKKIYPKFDLSRVSNSVTSIRACRNTVLVGSPPENLEVLFACRIPESYWGEMPNLKCLVTDDVHPQTLLPPNLETFCGHELPRNPPASLERVYCSGFNDDLPDNIKHLILAGSIGANVSHKLLKDLEILEVPCDSKLIQENLRESCPELKVLIVAGKGDIYAYGTLYEEDVDKFFQDGIYGHFDFDHATVNRASAFIDANKLPLGLVTLRLPQQVLTDFDISHLGSLKTFEGIVGRTVLPKSIETLIIKDPSALDSWHKGKSASDIENLLIGLPNLLTLSVPAITEDIYNVLISFTVTVFVSNYPSFKTGASCCQIIGTSAFCCGHIGEAPGFSSTGVITIMKDDTYATIKHTDVGDTIEFPGHGTVYNFIGHETLIGVNGDEVEVYCFTVPGECEIKQAKSARKAAP